MAEILEDEDIWGCFEKSLGFVVCVRGGGFGFGEFPIDVADCLSVGGICEAEADSGLVFVAFDEGG